MQSILSISFFFRILIVHSCFEEGSPVETSCLCGGQGWPSCTHGAMDISPEGRCLRQAEFAWCRFQEPERLLAFQQSGNQGLDVFVHFIVLDYVDSVVNPTVTLQLREIGDGLWPWLYHISGMWNLDTGFRSWQVGHGVQSILAGLERGAFHVPPVSLENLQMGPTSTE
jgi:hypothetical protein